MSFPPPVTAMSPAFTGPFAEHSCCRLGPAIALRDLAHAFLLRSKSDEAVLTIASACQANTYVTKTEINAISHIHAYYRTIFNVKTKAN